MEMTIAVTHKGVNYLLWVRSAVRPEISISVWQKQGEGWEGHSIHHFGNEQYRQVGPDCNPAKYQHLKICTPARIEAVTAAVNERVLLAREIINEVFELPRVARGLSEALAYSLRYMWNESRLTALCVPPIKAEFLPHIRVIEE